MKTIILSTESGSDLLPDKVQSSGIFVVPMHVMMDGKSREDGSFPVSELGEYYDRTKTIPTTSAVNPEEYMTFFRKLREEAEEADIVHIAYTSQASCTFQNAAIAIEELRQEGEQQIFLVDSKNVSGGISLILEKALELKAQISDGKELAEELERWVSRTAVTFLPDRLEFLKAGGRVSNAAYLGASFLRLKPAILIEDGRLVASKKHRGSMKHVAISYLEEFIRNNHLDQEYLYLFYSEGFSQTLLEKLKSRAAELGFQRIFVTVCGCVITCHGGFGALGIAGFRRLEEL